MELEETRSKQFFHVALRQAVRRRSAKEEHSVLQSWKPVNGPT